MDYSKYGINAYLKNQVKESSESENSQKPLSISKEIRRNSEPGKEPLVHKPIFEKIDSKVGEILNNKKLEQQALKDAEVAARTGIYYNRNSNNQGQTVEEAAQNLKDLNNAGLLKTSTPSTSKENQIDSIYRRVAKFLIVLGNDEAAKVLPHLSQEQIEKIIPEIASVRTVTKEEAAQVLEEFEGLIQQAKNSGGVDAAREILDKAFGPDKASSYMEKIGQFSTNGNPFEFLEGVDSERVLILLNDESPATKCLVLSQMIPKEAAAVINKMDIASKKEVVLRLARMEPVDPKIMEVTANALHDKLLKQNTVNSTTVDGRSALAQILKRMDPAAEQNILNTLSDQDPVLGADLRQRLFTQEDVLTADDKFLQNKLRNMEDMEIAFLIAGKSDEFKGKILKNVSRTRGELILEEMELHKPMLKSDCEKITSIFFSQLRRAWEQGELFIEGRSSGEQYV